MVTVEAASMLREIAGPRDWSDTRQSWLARAARKLGWDYARTSNIFYGRARIIRAEEWIQLNQEAAALRESAKARQEALYEIDLLLAAGKDAPKAGRPIGQPRLDGDEGEPSLPFKG